MQLKEDPANLPSDRQIIFLEGQSDHLIFDSLPSDCQRDLVLFLDKRWKEFATVYRAASRNPVYAEFMKTLMLPYNQEWYGGWAVHWQIIPRQHPPAKPPYRLEDYVIQIEKLQKLQPRK